MTTLVERRETKQKLLETSLDLIWENNYDCVGIVQICTQAGVTKGAFYHYFKSKADLAAAALEARWLKVRSQFDRVFSPQNRPLERVDYYCQLVVSMQVEKQVQTGRVLGCPFISTGQSSSEDKLKKISAEIIERMTRYFTSLVVDAQSEGFVDQALDPKKIATCMYVYAQGVLTIARVRNDLEFIKTDLKPGLLQILGVAKQ
ncbi:MAG: TetR/AcrR family transcriptional regulator [Mastigocoleus sp.]